MIQTPRAVAPAQIAFSTASLAGYSIPEACRAGRELGLTGIELLAFDGYRHSQGVLAGFYFDRLTTPEKDALLQATSPFEHVSVHAPFFENPLLSPNKALRDVAMHELLASFDATAFLGGGVVVTHAPQKGTFSLEEAWEELVEVYRRLGDYGGELGIKVTIETCFPTEIERFAQLIHEIDHVAVGATVDVGHLRALVPAALTAAPERAACYNDLLEAHIRSLGERLWHFHMHDTRFSDLRDHRACGQGGIDYVRVFRLTNEIGYRGRLVIEIEEPDGANAVAASRDVLGEALTAAAGSL